MVRPVLSPRIDGLGMRRVEDEEDECDVEADEEEEEALEDRGEVTAMAGATDGERGETVE
jgi:hypothetical protein